MVTGHPALGQKLVHVQLGPQKVGLVKVPVLKQKKRRAVQNLAQPQRFAGEIANEGNGRAVHHHGGQRALPVLQVGGQFRCDGTDGDAVDVIE